MIARAIWLCLAFVLPATAEAGQDCTPRRATVAEFRRSLELAAETARQLDRRGAEVAVLARVGQDLSRHGLRYSHLGLVYRDRTALGGRGAWRVVHKLNACGTDRGTLHRQGLAQFFSDGLHRFEAGVVILEPGFVAGLPAHLADNRWLRALHEPRYNMLAYPWATRYQQSNQWGLETLARWLEPTAGDRAAAQRVLRRTGYRPDTIRVGAIERLGARLGSAHIAFDDQPFARRMRGRIDTVTVESVFRWLHRQSLGGPEWRVAPPLGTTFQPLVSRLERTP
ncbi:MAG: DUF2145 domain-containing protein [Rhodocyclaceae bacterium]|nr:DUF2145 domain-containing protein [Rhodocyclaceae bacterium]